jgi:hypothetical protein
LDFTHDSTEIRGAEEGRNGLLPQKRLPP